MNNKYFLKKSHVSMFTYIMVTYITMLVLLIIIALKHNEIIVSLAFVFVLSTFITLMASKYYASTGLYIDGTNVYYKNIITRNVAVSDIAGIKIIQAYSAVGKYRGFYSLKNNKGELLFSAILLKRIDDKIRRYQKGDMWFNANYRGQIICSVVYDKDAIDYLKYLNPNIMIIY